MNDEYYMSIALKEAQKAFQKNEVPVGAVVVCNDRIIAKAHNLREANKLITSHAEILAIQKANKKKGTYRLDDCTIYVTLEPCGMCASAIQQSHIKRVVFACSDYKAGALGGLYDMYEIKKLNHYPLVSRGTLQKECSELLKSFFQNIRLNDKNDAK